MRTTTKKVKVIGREQWMNPYTREMEDFEVVSVEDRDFNFHKVWLESIINSMDLLGNQKTRLAFLDNRSSKQGKSACNDTAANFGAVGDFSENRIYNHESVIGIQFPP